MGSAGMSVLTLLMALPDLECEIVRLPAARAALRCGALSDGGGRARNADAGGITVVDLSIVAGVVTLDKMRALGAGVRGVVAGMVRRLNTGSPSSISTTVITFFLGRLYACVTPTSVYLSTSTCLRSSNLTSS